MELRVKALIYIGIVIATLIAYEPVRHNGFVSYDDSAYITENPHIRGGITQDSIVWAFTKSYSANWHPLTWLSHTLDYQLFGLNPLGYHLVSLLFHIISALLLFKILSDTTKTIWTSAFIAAVFALHPVQVEAVAWVAEQKTVLSGLFWLLTIAAYIRYTKQPRMRRYILLLLVFGLCIMTKPTVVTLPFALLLLDYWPLGRVKWNRLIIEKIPLFAMSATLCVITFVSQQSGGAVLPLDKRPLDFRIANMFISYTRYIGKTIWPSRLAVFYPSLPVNFMVVICCTLLFILMTVFSIYIIRRRKYIAVGWLWYVGTLVPMIGLVQVGMQTMANRYMYISILGLLIIAAWSVKDFIANRHRWKIVLAVLAAVVLSSAIILTRMQVRHWHSSITLLEYALKVTESNTGTEYGYGCALFEAGRLNEAVPHLSNAVRMSPTFAKARNNLGKVFLKQGKLNEAVACFNELIRRKQDSAETYYNLAVALSMQKKYDDAVKCLAKVIDLNPKYPGVHKRMGITLLAAGKADEAIKHLEEALRTNPNEAEVYVNLGLAYSKLGKYKPAIQNCTKAVKLKPDSANILNSMAWLLATAPDISVRDANKAIEIAQQACKLTEYKDAAILDTLAAAFAASGRFNDAITTAQQAVRIAKAHSQENLISEIQNHIELYKTGRKYIQK
jgi:tetratricopeptide (TPR) repeat protein